MLWRSYWGDSSVIKNFLRIAEANVKVMANQGTELFKHYHGRKIFKRYLKIKAPETLAGALGCALAFPVAA